MTMKASRSSFNRFFRLSHLLHRVEVRSAPSPLTLTLTLFLITQSVLCRSCQSLTFNPRRIYLILKGKSILSQGPNLFLYHPTIRTKKKKKQLFLNTFTCYSSINIHKERDRYNNTRLQQQGNSRHKSSRYSNTEVTVC